MKSILFAAMFTAATCTPQPAPTPSPAPVADASAWDAGPFDAASPPEGDIYDEACINLAAIGCPEGLQADCAATMRTIDSGRVTRLNPGCVAQCPDDTCVRRCTSAIKCRLPQHAMSNPDACSPAPSCSPSGDCPATQRCNAGCCLSDGSGNI